MGYLLFLRPFCPFFLKFYIPYYPGCKAMALFLGRFEKLSLLRVIRSWPYVRYKTWNDLVPETRPWPCNRGNTVSLCMINSCI